MTETLKPWDWRNGLKRKRSPESVVLIGGFACASGAVLLVAVFLLSFTIAGPPGADPHLVVAAFSVGFLALGLLGVRMGISQHRRGGGIGPSSRTKAK